MRRIFIVFIVLVAVHILWGQVGVTQPTPQLLPVSQNFSVGHDSFQYPVGWEGWQIPILSNLSPPLANLQVIPLSDASINAIGIHNYNGKYGFLGQQSSLVTAVNSIGYANVRISFDIMTIRNPYDVATSNNRINRVLLQYRLGTEGIFNNVPGFSYDNGMVRQVVGTAPQNNQYVQIILPAECANTPVLQLRWISTSVSGSGDQPSFAIDNVLIEGYDIETFGLTVSPGSLDFGSKVTHTITDQTVRITNNRAYPTSLTDLNLTIGTSSAFTIHDISDVMRNIDLDPGEYLEVTIRFNPTATGDHAGELRISEVSEPPKYVDLSGLCVPPMDVDFVVSNVTLDFGNVPLYIVSRQALSITNNGTDPGEITNLFIAGYPEFMFPDPIVLPKVIYPGDVWEFDIGFLPTMLGIKEGTLNVEGSLGFSQEVSLYGVGFDAPRPIISAVPNPMYKTMQEETISTEILTVLNTGTAPLNFTVNTLGIQPWLTVSVLSGSLPPGASMPIPLTFNTFGVPPSPSDRYTTSETSILILESDDPVNPNLTVTVYLTVTAMPIFVDFSATPLEGVCPLTVSFTDLSRLGSSMATADITGWRWDFQNDGVTDSFAQNPVHTYQMPGLYTVKLTIYTSTGGIHSKIKSGYIEAVNNPPVVFNPLDVIDDMLEDVAWGPYSAFNIFSDPDDHPLSFSSENSANIFVNFMGDMFSLSATKDWYGTETITLIASDPYGGSVSHPISVTVISVNDPPVIVMPDELYFIRNSHLAVNFADYINDPDNPDDEISIEIMSIGAAPIITVDYLPNVPGQLTAIFGAPPDWFGSETFQVTANDNMGRAIYSKIFDMIVLEYFSVQIGTDVGSDIAPIIYQYTGQTVNFRDNTLGNPDWFLWEFGDGNTSTERNPSHAYLQSGTYNVTLTLRNLEAGVQSTAFHTFINMFTFSGTAVYDVSTVQNWTDPSYNIFGDVTFDEDTEIGDEDTSVELIIFSQTPMNILANVNMNRVTLRPPAGSNYWGGLNFGSGSQGSLLNTNLIGARKPLRIFGSNPQIFNLTITPSDPDELIDDVGIDIEGDSSPNLNNVEVTNYRTGLRITPGRNRTTTPTITNTRVRNSTQGSRTEGERTIGIKVTGNVNMAMDNVDVVGYDLGMEINNEDSAFTTTPSLTNTRIRNSTQDSRPVDRETVGLKIAGNVGVILDDVEISGLDQGIVMENGTTSTHLTPTLTNTRVRNSTQGSRSMNVIGITLTNMPSIIMDGCEIDGFGNGMIINGTDFRSTMTPTLTNTRVRNSTQGSRSTSTGIVISGDVTLIMDYCDIEYYDYGIRYIGAGSIPRSTLTPTLTNTRVRNSTQSSRSYTFGMIITNIPRIRLDNCLVENYHVGIELTRQDARAEMTPTLTNTRVRNSTQGSRTENVGIFLGTGVLGKVENTTVEEAGIGILIADGNGTLLKRNTLKNCVIGIRGSGILPVLPVHRHVFILTDEFFMEHPNQNYRALDLIFNGPWMVANNTISGYDKAITASDATIVFVNNILWGSSFTAAPFNLFNSTIEQSYNNIRYDNGIYPGIGNINANPLFVNAAEDNYNLQYDSPCIDAGSPLMPPDEDGTVSDIGAFVYLHKADFIPTARFITVGTTVQFINHSIGHDHPATVTMWDLNNDGQIDGFSRDWSYQFNEPGWYDIRLKMISGTLEDEIVLERLIIVQIHQLKPPENLELSIDDVNLQLHWDAVTQTTNNLPIDVHYYLIYASDKPNGLFRFKAFTEAPVTSHFEPLDPMAKQKFYFVIGFSGSRQMLMDFIDRHREIDLPESNVIPTREIRSSKQN